MTPAFGGLKGTEKYFGGYGPGPAPAYDESTLYRIQEQQSEIERMFNTPATSGSQILATDVSPLPTIQYQEYQRPSFQTAEETMLQRTTPEYLAARESLYPEGRVTTVKNHYAPLSCHYSQEHCQKLCDEFHPGSTYVRDKGCFLGTW